MSNPTTLTTTKNQCAECISRTNGPICGLCYRPFCHECEKYSAFLGWPSVRCCLDKISCQDYLHSEIMSLERELTQTTNPVKIQDINMMLNHLRKSRAEKLHIGIYSLEKYRQELISLIKESKNNPNQSQLIAEYIKTNMNFP